MRYLFPILLCIASSAVACLNDYSTNLKATESSQSLIDQVTKTSYGEPWRTRQHRLEKELEAGGDYRVKNDLATTLAHLGEASEAVRLLEEIEAQKPGLYLTAANLGTAYELVGENQKALEWIRKGIERNPDSHQGTEWLHVRILEAKLAIEKSPYWLEWNSVLGPRKSGGPDVKTLHDNRGTRLTPDRVRDALIYQLHERVQFVHPPDAIVADLLLSLGYLAERQMKGSGTAVLGLARQYVTNAPGSAGFRDEVWAEEDKSSGRQIIRSWPMSVNIALIAAFGVFVFFRVRRWHQRIS